MPRRKKRILPVRSRTRIRSKNTLKFDIEPHIAKEIWSVMYMALAILFALSIANKLGVVGEFMQTIFKPIFGWGVYGLPVLCFFISLIFLFNRTPVFGLSRIFGIILLITSASTLIHLSVPSDEIYEVAKNGMYGGYIGFTGTFIGTTIFGVSGSYVIFSALLIISLLLTFHISLFDIFSLFVPQKKKTRALKEVNLKADLAHFLEDESDREINIIKPEISKKLLSVDDEESLVQLRKVASEEDEAPISEKESQQSLKEDEESIPILNEIPQEDEEYEWEYPSLDLLKIGNTEVVADDVHLKRSAELIRDKLAQFGIEVVMQDIHVGPTVVQYTLKPHEGVKLSKITSLKNDLALALAAKAIRIEAPIPGKALVGVEVPSEQRSMVYLRDILESDEFAKIDSPLRLSLGRDVSGKPMVSDFSRMPHLLIAGATGSGKSVGMNVFLLSILYQNSPKEVNFIMIDPKRVELNSYNGIPHLLTSVITDPEKATIALRWAVTEMTRRYQVLADSRRRNIKDYNFDPEIKGKMPFLIVVIDELADLMMTSGKEVEASICRIAQMGRAVGIHLMVATQRPSVDVITGLIKANIPTRVAFTVSSSIDSRVILDGLGAEDLLGEGDMLFLAGDMGKPVRIQGVYVSSEEIERVTNRLKVTYTPHYIEDITSRETAGLKVTGLPNSKMGGDLDVIDDDDDLYGDAFQIVSETGKASASLLQRRLRIGYARAARLLDILESKGVIGPVNGAKPRDVYVSRE